MPILPGLLAPVVGPPASQFLIYYSATTATVLARIFPPFKSQVTGILIAQKIQDKDLTKKYMHLAYRPLSSVIHYNKFPLHRGQKI